MNQIYDPPQEQDKEGCGKRLKYGQWWAFCGETDMGQTLPALCEECGGEFKLSEDQARYSAVAVVERPSWIHRLKSMFRIKARR